MKAGFTDSLQECLAAHVAEWIESRHGPEGESGFVVEVDSHPTDIDWPGQTRPDIWIRRTSAAHRIVVIEIEHRSSGAQAEANLQQAVDWHDAHPMRRVGFIHLIEAAANISPGRRLGLHALAADRRRLAYHQLEYEVFDGRASRQLADEIAGPGRQFKRRLAKTLRHAFLI